ncbi:TonB-dependent receptor plug domain-containing protein [Gemmatimonadota bacterium]
MLPLGAQGSGSILGRISDEATGAILPTALVSVTGPGLSVLSGDEGWYFLTGIPEGRQEISVVLIGYGTVRETVLVRPGDAITLDFQLKAEAIPIDEVRVVAEPRLRENLTHRKVISSEEIVRRQAGTVTQLLQGLVPGMTQTVTSGDVGAAARIRIRGVRSLEDTPPLFFLDGVRIGSAGFNAPTGAGGSVLTFLDNINPKDIDRIEILHATEATILYGTNASGGAVLIFTRRRE